MTDSSRSLSREYLYELVWAKPATHIARELAIKPAAVLKACKLLNIPRPTTGHWVKLEHGQSPLRPTLPRFLLLATLVPAPLFQVQH